jgi:colicin import membrane protein
VSYMAIALSAMSIHSACLAQAADDINVRYPQGSIDSSDKADAALAAATEARGRADATQKKGETECYKKFLANACLDKVHAANRAELDRISAVELEANRFKRIEHVRQAEADRARHASDREATAVDDAHQREMNTASYQDKQSSAVHTSDQRATDAQGDPERAQAYADKIKAANDHNTQKRAQDLADEPERKTSAQAFADKQAKATERREHVEKKQAEKAAQHAQKDAAAAAKPGAPSASSASPATAPPTQAAPPVPVVTPAAKP